MKLQPPKDRLRLEAAPETEVEVGSPVWERLALLNPVLLLRVCNLPRGLGFQRNLKLHLVVIHRTAYGTAQSSVGLRCRCFLMESEFVLS